MSIDAPARDNPREFRRDLVRVDDADDQRRGWRLELSRSPFDEARELEQERRLHTRLRDLRALRECPRHGGEPNQQPE